MLADKKKGIIGKVKEAIEKKKEAKEEEKKKAAVTKSSQKSTSVVGAGQGVHDHASRCDSQQIQSLKRSKRRRHPTCRRCTAACSRPVADATSRHQQAPRDAAGRAISPPHARMLVPVMLPDCLSRSLSSRTARVAPPRAVLATLRPPPPHHTSGWHAGEQEALAAKPAMPET